MIPTCAQYLAAVKREMYKKEGRNNSTIYGTWYGLPNQPYCAMGLSYVAHNFGTDASSIIGKFASVSAWAAWAQRNGTYHSGHAGIRVGDVVFYTYSHVEVVYGVTSSTILTYGFNTSSGVVGSQRNGEGNYPRVRARNSLIRGYHRPRYATATPKPAPVPTHRPTADAKVRSWQYVLAFGASDRDGDFGPNTLARSNMMRYAALHNGTRMMSLKRSTIQLVQRIIHTIPDGVFGHASTQMMKLWIKRAQTVLGVTTDGDWGPKTDAAYQAFVRSVYKRY